ncbi:MAG: YoaP domain-containing protein [Chitinispirillales bacterium]|jgi:hypothetical protein|nr:YoaP domain-containing protein [Chitinispirillales bacterium]
MDTKFITLTKENIDREHICCAISDKKCAESYAAKKGWLKLVKLETMEQAQSSPTPATIFSLFYNGKFVTTDISSCLNSRFDKTVKTK